MSPFTLNRKEVMVTIDQLRISDDGKNLYLDAHINKASYFDNVYMDKVTILTEDQVSELDPLSFGSDYIYQEEVAASGDVEQLYDKPVVLSERQLTKKATGDGGWMIDFSAKLEATSNAISLIFSGKFSAFGDSTPVLLVTNADYSASQGTDGGNVLFKVYGTLYDNEYDPGHPIYRFTGKGDVRDNSILKFYLYKTNSDGTHTLVRLDETDDINFLHFYYMPYSNVKVEGKKEVHLVLSINDFNEKFKAKDMTENMFFVYITATGTPASDTPCRLDEMTTLGVTLDYGLIYNNALCYTRELADSCNVPMGFIDFIMNYEALRLAVETEHYLVAIDHFNWLKNNGCAGNGTITKGCGCHG